MRCPNCGTENTETNRFCLGCGTALAGEGARSETPPEQVEATATPEPDAYRAPKPSVTSTGGSATRPEYTSRSRIDKLGDRIDGWADLIDNASQHTQELQKFVWQRLHERHMPEISCRDYRLTPGRWAGEERLYHLAAHRIGATIAVYIAAFGRDLYVSWDLFVKQVWNRAVLYAILILSGIISLISYLGSLGAVGRYSSSLGRVGRYLTLGTVVGGFVGAIFSTIGMAIGFGILLGIAGLVLKRNFWAFLKLQYTHFRLDDVAAMGLAVHHSLLEGLDHIGVSRASIRPKEQFRAGRRERII